MSNFSPRGPTLGNVAMSSCSMISHLIIRWIQTGLTLWAHRLAHSVGVGGTYNLGSHHVVSQRGSRKDSHVSCSWPCNAARRCGLMVASPCSAGLLRILALIFVLIASWIFIHRHSSLSTGTLRLPRWLGECGALLGGACGPGLKAPDRALSHPWVTQ